MNTQVTPNNPYCSILSNKQKQSRIKLDEKCELLGLITFLTVISVELLLVCTDEMEELDTLIMKLQSNIIYIVRD